MKGMETVPVSVIGGMMSKILNGLVKSLTDTYTDTDTKIGKER